MIQTTITFSELSSLLQKVSQNTCMPYSPFLSSDLTDNPFSKSGFKHHKSYVFSSDFATFTTVGDSTHSESLPTQIAQAYDYFTQTITR